MDIEQIWSHFHMQLKTFISRRVHRPNDADDILQNVYVKILNQLPNLRDEQKLHAWIYQIARNTLIDYYRKEKPIEELPEEIIFHQEPETNLNQELIKCLKSFVNQLPDKYRTAIQLTEYAGYSQKQLSEQLGISLSGAKSRVQRGRQKLKELIIACCHLELDRFGNVLDYKPNRPVAQSSCCTCK